MQLEWSVAGEGPRRDRRRPPYAHPCPRRRRLPPRQPPVATLILSTQVFSRLFPSLELPRWCDALLSDSDAMCFSLPFVKFRRHTLTRSSSIFVFLRFSPSFELLCWWFSSDVLLCFSQPFVKPYRLLAVTLPPSSSPVFLSLFFVIFPLPQYAGHPCHFLARLVPVTLLLHKYFRSDVSIASFLAVPKVCVPFSNHSNHVICFLRSFGSSLSFMVSLDNISTLIILMGSVWCH